MTDDDAFFAPEPLHEDLVPHIGTGPLGKAIWHRLIHEVMYVPALNRMINQRYRFKLDAVNEAVRTGDWHRYIFMHERPYRAEALSDVLFGYEVAAEVAGELVREVWMDSENIRQLLPLWRDIWTAAEAGYLAHVMTEADAAALAKLPARVKVYRGVGHRDAVPGISWTTDRNKAVWFARRWAGAAGRQPMLVRGIAEKSNVLAYLLGRGEHEIVVLPEDVTNQAISLKV